MVSPLLTFSYEKPYLYLYYMLTKPTHLYTRPFPVPLYDTCTIIHRTLLYHITTNQIHHLPIFTTPIKTISYSKQCPALPFP